MRAMDGTDSPLPPSRLTDSRRGGLDRDWSRLADQILFLDSCGANSRFSAENENQSNARVLFGDCLCTGERAAAVGVEGN